MFQEKNATLGKAAILIKSVLQTFENSKSTLAFNHLWLEIQDFAIDYNINFDIPFQTQKEPNEVDNATAEDYFRVNAYFKVLDSIIVNMKKRFSTESLEMAESIDNFFKMNIEKSKFFINHYKDLLDINSYNLKSEITVVKNYLTLTIGKDDVCLEDLKTCIVVNVYPNMCKLLQVALTLSISSATSKLYTIGVDYNFSRESGTHTHESIDTNIIVRQKISNGIKRKGLDYITDRPSKLIKLEIANNVEAASTLTCKDTKLIRDSISRECLRNLPKLPKSILEVHEYINNTKPITVKDEYFIITNDPLDHIIIFSCDSNLNFMCDSPTLYVDGTFKYCAKFFHQLFSIHAYRNGVFVPVVFCLLPNKNKDTYTAIWEILLEKCQSLNKCLQPRTLVIDFETSIHSSVKDIFPI
ncbi:hypothetical protein QTP88_001620 [Uroleucon formosanum]